MDIWTEIINLEMKKDYFQNLIKKINNERKINPVYPVSNLVFNAFKMTPFEKVKVVILGQDPYHQPNQANGLSFSVNKNCQIPPSLRNIFKELKNDINIIKDDGDLTSWAKQGVLLLNTCLTVSEGKPHSHKEWGWEQFTDYVITTLDDKIQPIFVLWGNSAQKKLSLIKNSPFIISSHPSPFSYRHSFKGSRPFSQINQHLINQKKEEIKW